MEDGSGSPEPISGRGPHGPQINLVFGSAQAMTNSLSNNLFRLFYRKTKSTSLKRLERRGLKNVSVLNLKDLKTLIQQGVDSTLASMGITLSAQDLQQVNERTREQLVKIITDRNELEASVRYMAQELDQLKDNSLLLKTELEVNRRLLSKEEKLVRSGSTIPGVSIDGGLNGTTPSPSSDVDIESLLSDRLKGLFEDHQDGRALHKDAIRITMNVLAEEREQALERARADHETRIDQLKRRINKLNAKLNETETLLSRVRAESTMDPGVASEFRDVQGISDQAVFKEEKKALLQEIFTLNKELKQMIKERQIS